MKPGITVVTPSIPTRHHYLAENMASVATQTLPPEAHLIVVDISAAGEAVTRTRGLMAVDTEWTAFLDDDDWLYPHHLQSLMMHQETTGADLVYPWFDVVGGTDPLGWEGKEFDPAAIREANYIPVTTLVRTELAQAVGGFPTPESGVYPSILACVDWRFLINLLDAGARFAHLPKRTWAWRHHGDNQSGRRWREQANV